MKELVLRISVVLVLLVGAAVALFTLEHPPAQTVQRGFRGTGMELVYNPATVETFLAANQPPEAPELADEEGPRASEIFENVQVLGNVSAAQFGRVMQSMTEWVSPQGGCNYCHNPENYAEDTVYTKVVARRMLQMVARVNADWTPHVGQTGVTCYTCHRGNPVPANVWSVAPEAGRATGILETATGQNRVAAASGLSSLPYDPFTPFMLQDNEVRIASQTALPAGNRQSIKQTEWTYGLMMHFSEALGVNCTHCHNSRAFSDWEQSSPERSSAWYGLRMVRDLNQHYLEPLRSTFPAQRLGALGDTLKVNCATCHQGVYKPLYGVNMLRDNPELLRIGPTAASAEAPAVPASEAPTERP